MTQLYGIKEFDDRPLHNGIFGNLHRFTCFLTAFRKINKANNQL